MELSLIEEEYENGNMQAPSPLLNFRRKLLHKTIYLMGSILPRRLTLPQAYKPAQGQTDLLLTPA